MSWRAFRDGWFIFWNVEKSIKPNFELTKEDRGEFLDIYVDLMNLHGQYSKKARDFYRKYSCYPEFRELMDTARFFAVNCDEIFGEEESEVR